MRTLTSVQSATYHRLLATLRVQAADASTTWVFSGTRLSDLTPLEWALPWGGGFGRTSDYNVTLTASPGWFNTYRDVLVGARTWLSIQINSDEITPHVGRIKSFHRDGEDLNKASLHIYDRVLNDDPLVPAIAITDSWANPHPDDLDSGYPLYYGQQTQRPAPFVAVNCNLTQFLGCRNIVDSHHAIDSRSLGIYVGRFLSTGVFSDGFNTLASDLIRRLIPGTWAYETGSTNLFAVACGGGVSFPWIDIDSPFGNSYNAIPIIDTRDYSAVSGSLPSVSSIDPTSGGYVVINANLAAGTTYTYITQVQGTDGGSGALYGIRPHCQITRRGSEPGTCVYSVQFGFAVSFSETIVSCTVIYNGVSSNAALAITNAFSHFNPLSTFYWIAVDTPLAQLYSRGGQHYFIFTIRASAASSVQLQVAYNPIAGMSPSLYGKYKVVANVQSGVAISTNPAQIWAHICCSELSAQNIPLNTAQNSATQVALGDYVFNCVFLERESFSSIMDEFGRQTSTFIWISDSGYLNSRAYVQSATATNTIAVTVGSGDLVSFSMREAPLGSNTFDPDQASRIELSYNYDYQRGSFTGQRPSGTGITFKQPPFFRDWGPFPRTQPYAGDLSKLILFPANNAYCDSVAARGVRTTVARESRWIMTAAVASLYAGSLLRKHATAQNLAYIKLPARFFGLEPADIVRVYHPALPNSVSLFQALRVQHDYVNAIVSIEAMELQNL